MNGLTQSFMAQMPLKKENKCWWISGLKITFLNQHSIPILIRAMEAELHI